MNNENRKTEIRFFTICEWKKEQEYLRNRHKAGWKFVCVNLVGCYHFEKCEPKDVIYQLDYNQEGILHKKEYIQMFADCGWEYLQDYVGYSYFRKPVSAMHDGAEEIFCDDNSRLDMMKRVFKGRLLPLVVLFFCVVLPQIFVQHHLGGQMGRILSATFGVVAFFYIVNFLWFGYQFWSYWKSYQK